MRHTVLNLVKGFASSAKQRRSWCLTADRQRSFNKRVNGMKKDLKTCTLADRLVERSERSRKRESKESDFFP